MATRSWSSTTTNTSAPDHQDRSRSCSGVIRIDARLQSLDRELAPLRTSWVGDAQRAYSVAQARWDTAVREMRDLLRSTAQQVTVANDAYRAADARGARAFGG